jgi:hypothetical protein
MLHTIPEELKKLKYLEVLNLADRNLLLQGSDLKPRNMNEVVRETDPECLKDPPVRVTVSGETVPEPFKCPTVAKKSADRTDDLDNVLDTLETKYPERTYEDANWTHTLDYREWDLAVGTFGFSHFDRLWSIRFDTSQKNGNMQGTPILHTRAWSAAVLTLAFGRTGFSVRDCFGGTPDPDFSETGGLPPVLGNGIIVTGEVGDPVWRGTVNRGNERPFDWELQRRDWEDFLADYFDTNAGGNRLPYTDRTRPPTAEEGVQSEIDDPVTTVSLRLEFSNCVESCPMFFQPEPDGPPQRLLNGTAWSKNPRHIFVDGNVTFEFTARGGPPDEVKLRGWLRDEKNNTKYHGVRENGWCSRVLCSSDFYTDSKMQRCVECTDDVKLTPVKMIGLGVALFVAISLLGFATRPHSLELESRCVVLCGRVDNSLGTAYALQRPIAKLLDCKPVDIHCDDHPAKLQEGDRAFIYVRLAPNTVSPV